MEDRFVVTPFVLDKAEDALREVAESDWVVNAPKLEQDTATARMAELYEPLAQFVERTVRAGKRPMSLVGDCCTTIGVVAGLQRAGVSPTLLWLDAHGDFNTWETTGSGFIGGMPLAMLVGRGEQTMVDAVRMKNLAEEDVVLADARDLDVPERAALEKSNVLRLSDLNEVLASERLHAPLYVHFDSDIVNPNDAPAQGYATAGGPSAQQMKEFFEALAKSGKVVAFSMCAWSPRLDTDGKTRAVCMDLFRTMADG